MNRERDGETADLSMVKDVVGSFSESWDAYHRLVTETRLLIIWGFVLA